MKYIRTRHQNSKNDCLRVIQMSPGFLVIKDQNQQIGEVISSEIGWGCFTNHLFEEKPYAIYKDRDVAIDAVIAKDRKKPLPPQDS